MVGHKYIVVNSAWLDLKLTGKVIILYFSVGLNSWNCTSFFSPDLVGIDVTFVDAAATGCFFVGRGDLWQ